MSQTKGGEERIGIRAFILSFDLPEAFAKAAARVMQSHAKLFVEDDLNSRLPAIMERLPDVLGSMGIDEAYLDGVKDYLEGASETLIDLGSETAGELTAMVGVPLLNLVLRRVKDASIKREVRESERRLHDHLDRIEVIIEALRRELKEGLAGLENRIGRRLENQLDRLSARDFLRAVNLAEYALRHPCRTKIERESQIRDLEVAIRHLTLVEADMLGDAAAEEERFVISLLIGLSALLVPAKRGVAHRKLGEAIAAIDAELSKSNVRVGNHRRDIENLGLKIQELEGLQNSGILKAIRDKRESIKSEISVFVQKYIYEDCGSSSVSDKFSDFIYESIKVLRREITHKYGYELHPRVIKDYIKQHIKENKYQIIVDIAHLGIEVVETEYNERQKKIDNYRKEIQQVIDGPLTLEERMVVEMRNFATSLRALAQGATLPAG